MRFTHTEDGITVGDLPGWCNPRGTFAGWYLDANLWADEAANSPFYTDDPIGELHHIIYNRKFHCWDRHEGPRATIITITRSDAEAIEKALRETTIPWTKPEKSNE